MATNSSILAWRIPWKEELGRVQPMDMTEQLTFIAISLWRLFRVKGLSCQMRDLKLN